MNQSTSADIRRYSRRTHAEKLAAAHARRARDIHGSWNGSWSARQWEALLDAWDYRCAYCGKQLDADALTPDHRLPLCRGGRNAIDNLLPACQSCNSAKGGKTEDEYRAYLAQKDQPMNAKHSRLETAILDCMMPKNLRAVVRNRLRDCLTTIYTAHGNPDRYAEEREAFRRLAAISEALFGDSDRLNRAVRPKLLKEDLKALGEEVA